MVPSPFVRSDLVQSAFWVKRSLWLLALMGALWWGGASASALTYTVNSTNDQDDTVCDGGHCSLREAINAANANPGGDAIVFSVTGTITLGSSLPNVTDGVDIDGNSAGVTVNGNGFPILTLQSNNSNLRGMTFTNSNGTSPEALLYLTGTGATVGGSDGTDRMIFTDTGGHSGQFIQVMGSGYTIRNSYFGLAADGATVQATNNPILFNGASGSNVVQDNVIVGSGGCGIQFFTSLGGSLTIKANKIGVKADGTTVAGNSVGICDRNDGSYSATILIGGPNDADRNIIAGNNDDGINLDGAYTGSITVQKNYIGLNNSGTAAANGNDGVELGGVCNTLGNCQLLSNVISGNAQNGVRIRDNATRWQLLSNNIGTNAAGTAAIANGAHGIHFLDSPSNVYVGRADNAYSNHNVISGNVNQGIYLQSLTGGPVIISSNHIGVNAAGNAALSNGGNGIRIEGGSASASIQIGNSTAMTMTNVISGNGAAGIYAGNTYAGNLSVYSSNIGLNQAQNADLGNAGHGVDLASNGGTTGTVMIGNSLMSGGFNVIAGNAGSGIVSDGGATETYKGNYIGTTAGGSAFKNDGNGISVSNNASVTGPTIGGSISAGQVNVIANHTVSGEILNEQILVKGQVSGTKIYANYIGVAPNGNVLGGDHGIGVYAPNTEIGSSNGDHRNFIGGLNQYAVRFNGASVSGSKLRNTYIGLKPDGSTSNAGNTKGVLLDGAAGQVAIGGTSGPEANYIANLLDDAIQLSDANNVMIIGNYIGVGADGLTDKGNGGDGIQIQNSNNIGIGRDVPGTMFKGNIISGNAGNGIHVNGSGNISYITIAGNLIGLVKNKNTGIISKVANDQDGIHVITGTTITIGGTTNNDVNFIGGNGGDGIELVNVTGNTIRGNYIGTDGTFADLGNTGRGVWLNGGSTGNTLGYAYADTMTGYFNYIGFNDGAADVVFDGASTNVARGNIFDLAAGDTSPNWGFTNGANSGMDLGGVTPVTLDTSRVLASTSFPNGSKLDVYSLHGTTTTYEGTATAEGAKFQLDKDFAAVAGDYYVVQVTNASGNSSISSKANSAVVADVVAPAAPTLASNLYTNNANYIFTGTKEAHSGISVNGGATTHVAVDASTSWSYAVGTPLSEGANAFNLVAIDYSQNLSAATALIITLDTVAPVAPTVTSALNLTGTGSTAQFSIAGTKEAGASVWSDGTEKVSSTESTTFSFEVTLNPGANTFSALVQKDRAGNSSPAASAYTVTYTQVAPTTSGGGGGGGGGGYSNQATTTSPQNNNDEEEEEVTGNDPVEEPSSNAQSGESESTEQGNSSSGESEGPVEESDDSGSSDSGEPVESQTDGTSSVQEPTVAEEADQAADQDSANGSTNGSVGESDSLVGGFLDDVESLYPTAEEEAEEETQVFSDENDDGVNDNFYPPKRDFLMPPHERAPIWKPIIGRETLLQNPLYTAPFKDRNDNKIPDWWEKKFFESKGVTPDTTTDTDADGITDVEEFYANTNPTSSDTDEDGIPDATEQEADLDPNGWDSDDDGLSDLQEWNLGTDPLSSDTDADGVSDTVELAWGGDPWTSHNAPVSTLIGGGVPDAWLKTYDLVELYTEEQSVEVAGQEIEVTIESWDSDLDGLSDYDELLNNTNPLEADTDGDGALDGEEVHLYGTNPILLTASSEFFKLKLAHLAIHFKATYFEDQPVFLGSSQPRTTVQWQLVPMEAELAKAYLFPQWSLYADLFNASEEDELSGSVEVDESGKFLIRPEVSIQTGDYALIIQSVDDEGNVVEETLPYDLKVDGDTSADWVDPKQLDDFVIDLTSLELIRLNNEQPYLYGVAGGGYEVVTAWQSELFTSSLVVDTTEGEFVTAAPSALEQGLHDLYVYAYDPDMNAYSSVINIDFEVLSGSLYSSAEGNPWMRLIVFGVVGGLVFVGILGWWSSHHRRMTSIHSALEGRDPNFKA